MKTALITGACGGIGSAIVNYFLEQGFTVFGLDLSESHISNDNYFHVVTDITSDESVDSAFNVISQRTNSLDALVNVAGIMFMGSVVEQPASLMQKIMDVNVTGMCRITKCFFPLIEQAKGRIVNFSSEYGTYTTVPFHAYYTASKHAVESYTDGLRRELKFLGVKVITIRPGACDTEMTKSTYPYFEKLCKETTHYSKQYNTLKPFMINGTKNATNPTVLAKVIYKAVTVKHPKRVYKINNDKLVGFFSVLPPKLIDFIFCKFFS